MSKLRRIGADRRVLKRGLLMGAEPVRAASELATSTALLPLLALERRGDVIAYWSYQDYLPAIAAHFRYDDF